MNLKSSSHVRTRKEKKLHGRVQNLYRPRQCDGYGWGKIVTSLVNDILMPIVGILIGGLDFTGLKIQVGTATITYGNFIQNVVDFLIVAACIFAMLKFLAHFKKTTNDQLD